MKIVKIFVAASGDPSVGIFGASCVIQADGDWILDTEECDDEGIQSFRGLIADAFEHIWGECPSVAFDFEVDAQEKAFAEAEALHD